MLEKIDALFDKMLDADYNLSDDSFRQIFNLEDMEMWQDERNEIAEILSMGEAIIF